MNIHRPCAGRGGSWLCRLATLTVSLPVRCVAGGDMPLTVTVTGLAPSSHRMPAALPQTLPRPGPGNGIIR